MGMTTPVSLLRHHLLGNVLTQGAPAKLSPSLLAGTVEVARSLQLLPLPWRGITWPWSPPAPSTGSLAKPVAVGGFTPASGMAWGGGLCHGAALPPEAAPIRDTLMIAGRGDTPDTLAQEHPWGGE